MGMSVRPVGSLMQRRGHAIDMQANLPGDAWVHDQGAATCSWDALQHGYRDHVLFTTKFVTRTVAVRSQ